MNNKFNMINVDEIIIPDKEERKISNKEEKKEERKISNKIEIYLDNNKYNNKFALMSNNKKNKVIDLGINSLKLSDNRMLKWSEKESSQKIITMSKEYETNIDDYKKKLKKEKEHSLHLKQQFKKEKDVYEKQIHKLKAETINELNKQESEIKNNCHLLYKNQLIDKENIVQKLKNEQSNLKREKEEEINKLKQKHKKEYQEEKERLKEVYSSSSSEKLKIKEEELSNLKTELSLLKKEGKEEVFKIRTECDNKLKEKDKLHSEEREKIRTQSKNEIVEILNNMSKKNEVASVKGQIGEMQVYNLLREFFPECPIVDTSHAGGKGDLVITIQEKWNHLIEVKNYKTNMKKKEVNKFIKDTKNNKDIHIGIMISLHTNIPNKTNKEKKIHIEYVDNKPHIFIGNLSDNRETLKNVLNMTPELLNLSANTINSDKITKITSIIEYSIKTSQKQLKDLNKYYNDMKKEIEKQDKNLTEIINILIQ